MSNYFDCPRIVKQGSVLSSSLCSSSTAELCDSNHTGGTLVGSLVVNDILYVDDTTDINDNINETIQSHYEVVNFAKSKSLSLNYSKCYIVNKNKHYCTPTLKVGDGTVKQVTNTKFLGDVINDKGSNTDMIEDKVAKAKAALTNCIALCNEVTMGMYFVKAATVLYQSVFLATLLFNSQAWRNLTKTDIKRLETIQLRYLKRVMKAPLSTPNSFVFLEFGTLPASYIIHSRQLTFFHRIVSLDDSDPVKKMHVAQQLFP